MYYDRQGQPMCFMHWAGKMQDRNYQVVAQNWVRGWMVSTIWLVQQGPGVLGGVDILPSLKEGDSS